MAILQVQHMNCCLMTEIDGLSNFNDPDYTMRWFLHVSRPPLLLGPRSVIIFSGAREKKGEEAKYALDFKAFIENEGLGEVWTLDQVKNKNGKNWVTVYMWIVNQANTEAWRNTHPFTRKDNHVHQADDLDRPAGTRPTPVVEP